MRRVQLNLLFEAFETYTKLKEAIFESIAGGRTKTLLLTPPELIAVIKVAKQLDEQLAALELEVTRQALIRMAHTLGGRDSEYGRRYSKSQTQEVSRALEQIRITMRYELASRMAFIIGPKLKRAAEKTAQTENLSLTSLVENLLTDAARKAGHWPNTTARSKK